MSAPVVVASPPLPKDAPIVVTPSQRPAGEIVTHLAPEKSKLWLWLIVGAIAAIAIGVLVWAFIKYLEPKPQANVVVVGAPTSVGSRGAPTGGNNSPAGPSGGGSGDNGGGSGGDYPPYGPSGGGGGDNGGGGGESGGGDYPPYGPSGGGGDNGGGGGESGGGYYYDYRPRRQQAMSRY